LEGACEYELSRGCPLPPGVHRSEEHTPVVLYDNHHPKGHHRHLRRKTGPYGFRGVDRLLQDFRSDVARVREGKL
jgi:hypothetical protein